MPRIINPLDDKHRDIRLFVRQLETRHSIIAGFDIEHHLVTHGSHPAWSIGNQIYFNASKLPAPRTVETITDVTGVGYHELAHVLFTPTIVDFNRVWPGNPIVEKLMRNPAYAGAFNVLEDQRIETLLLRRYRRMKPYFVKMFLSVVMAGATEESYKTLYTLVRGRRYLSKRYRRMVRKRFANQTIVRELASIIDAFCILNLTKRDGMEAADILITRYMKLMDDASLTAPPAHMNCVAIASSTNYDSRSQTQDAQQIAQDVAKIAAEIKAENAKDDEAKNDDAPGAAASDDGGQDDSGLASGDGKASIRSDGQSGKGDGSGDAQGGAQAGGNGTDGGQGSSNGGQDGQGTGAGSGVSDPTSANPTADDMLADAVRQMAAAIDHADVRADIADVRKVMRQATQLSSTINHQKKWAPHVPEELMGVANRTYKELQRLEVDTDPHWNRRVSAGRLNVQRVMLGEQDTEQMFDRWEEGGLGGNDQEWVVLLDQSTSMRSRFSDLGSAAWVMKRAADKLQAKMTILGYGSVGNRVCIYNGNERAKTNALPMLGSLGNTDPLQAIVEAHAVLTNSTRSIKGLLVMTDGHWGTTHNSMMIGHTRVTDAGLIAQMAKDRVVTCLTWMGNGSVTSAGRGDKHGAELYEEINAVPELPQVMRRLIAAQMRKAK